MARGRRDGILIAGGGLAGCLAALAMARFRPEVPLLIVEERETFGGEGYRLFADAELDDDGRDLLNPVIDRPLAGLLRRLPRLQPQAQGRSERLRRRGSPCRDGRGAEARTATGSAPRSSRCARTRWCSTAARRSRRKARSTRAAPPTYSTLDLLYEARFERDYRFRAPHRVDRPVLVDATVDQSGGPPLRPVHPLVRGAAAGRRRLVSERGPARRRRRRSARRLCRGARLEEAAR